MTTIKKDKIRPDWLGKTLAGALLGLAWQWLSVVSLPGWGLVE